MIASAAFARYAGHLLNSWALASPRDEVAERISLVVARARERYGVGLEIVNIVYSDVLAGRAEGSHFASFHIILAQERGDEMNLLKGGPRLQPIGTEIKENHELSWIAFGGKCHLVGDPIGGYHCATFDQEYIGGNAHLMSGVFSPAHPPRRRIDAFEVRQPARSATEAVSRLFWAIDLEDVSLFRSVVSEDAALSLARTDESPVEYHVGTDAQAFLRAAGSAASVMNFHSTSVQHRRGATGDSFAAFRYRPDLLGNKFRGARQKSTLFFNEIYDIDTRRGEDHFMVTSMHSRFVEVPHIPDGVVVHL